MPKPIPDPKLYETKPGRTNPPRRRRRYRPWQPPTEATVEPEKATEPKTTVKAKPKAKPADADS